MMVVVEAEGLRVARWFLRRVQQWSMSATGTKARPNTAQKSDLRTASVTKVGSTVVKCLMIACFK